MCESAGMWREWRRSGRSGSRTGWRGSTTNPSSPGALYPSSLALRYAPFNSINIQSVVDPLPLTVPVTALYPSSLTLRYTPFTFINIQKSGPLTVPVTSLYPSSLALRYTYTPFTSIYIQKSGRTPPPNWLARWQVVSGLGNKICLYFSLDRWQLQSKPYLPYYWWRHSIDVYSFCKGNDEISRFSLHINHLLV